MSSIAAWIYVVTIGATVLFQIGLAAGMPWGAAAMGGRYPGTFPRQMRIAALAQAAILTGLAAIVAVRAGILVAGWFDASRTLVWVVVVIAAISVILNWSTPSKLERRIWGPITTVMLICSIVVAVN